MKLQPQREYLPQNVVKGVTWPGLEYEYKSPPVTNTGAMGSSPESSTPLEAETLPQSDSNNSSNVEPSILFSRYPMRIHHPPQQLYGTLTDT